MQSVTLIIDKRLELSTKYKKLLETETNKVIISKDLITSIKLIQDKEPDLIIISDSFDDDLSDFCKQVRALTYNMRPIIVAMSKSADINDRIKVLESGADDFLSEPVNSEEFKAFKIRKENYQKIEGCKKFNTLELESGEEYPNYDEYVEFYAEKGFTDNSAVNRRVTAAVAKCPTLPLLASEQGWERSVIR